MAEETDRPDLKPNPHKQLWWASYGLWMAEHICAKIQFYVYNWFQVVKSILLFTSHTLPASNWIRCASPSMSFTRIIWKPWFSPVHYTRIMPSSPHGFAGPGSHSSFPIATSWTLSILSWILKSPSTRPIILLLSWPVCNSIGPHSRQRTHTQSTLRLPRFLNSWFPVHLMTWMSSSSPWNCVKGTERLL